MAGGGLEAAWSRLGRVAGDAELLQHGGGVVVDALADQGVALEDEDGEELLLEAAAGRRQAASGPAWVPRAIASIRTASSAVWSVTISIS